MEDTIEVGIRKKLPFIENNTLNALLEHLIDLGVSKNAELSLIEEGDLKGVLKPIQARILIKYWKTENEPNISSKDQDDSSQVNPHDITPNKGFDNLDWAFDYTVPWESMPRELIKMLEEKKRPTPSLRRNLVQIVSDSICKIDSKPGRKALSIIAREMVKKYPDSLSDTLCGEVVGEGHLSLAKQMEVRFDNLNRTSQYSVMKRSLKERVGEKKIKMADAYGCVNWQPKIMPVNENDETQEEKRLIMLAKPPSKYLDADNKKLLTDTYFSQRKTINSKTSIKKIKTKWPLLCTKEGLFLHFKMLMEINFDKLNDALSKKGDRIFNFLKTLPCQKKNLNKMELVLQKCSNVEGTDLFTLLRLLSIYFDEDVEEMLISVDITLDVEQLDLPSTPTLVYYGDDAKESKSYTLYIDQKLVVTVDNFLDGFSVLFISFYVFNIHYPRRSSTTLEFVQRCFLGINPNRGTKRNPNGKTKEAINFKILNLINKVSEHELIDL